MTEDEKVGEDYDARDLARASWGPQRRKVYIDTGVTWILGKEDQVEEDTAIKDAEAVDCEEDNGGVLVLGIPGGREQALKIAEEEGWEVVPGPLPPSEENLREVAECKRVARQLSWQLAKAGFTPLSWVTEGS